MDRMGRVISQRSDHEESPTITARKAVAVGLVIAARAAIGRAWTSEGAAAAMKVGAVAARRRAGVDDRRHAVFVDLQRGDGGPCLGAGRSFWSGTAGSIGFATPLVPYSSAPESSLQCISGTGRILGRSGLMAQAHYVRPVMRAQHCRHRVGDVLPDLRQRRKLSRDSADTAQRPPVVGSGETTATRQGGFPLCQTAVRHGTNVSF